MNKNNNLIKTGKGVRTFLIYFSIVFLTILIAVSIKAFFLLNESKYDGNNIIIVISQNKKIVGILGLDATKNTFSRLVLKNSRIPVSRSAEYLGIIPDATIDSKSDYSKANIQSILIDAAQRKNGLKTNLTIFDTIRLLFLSKNISNNEIAEKEIILPLPDYNIDQNIRLLFSNDLVRSENVSIEIVNATDEAGLGKQLERTLANLGFDVLSVTTQKDPEKISKVLYTSNSSYVFSKISRLLRYPAFKNTGKPIADIVIILGEDSKNATAFSNYLLFVFK